VGGAIASVGFISDLGRGAAFFLFALVFFLPIRLAFFLFPFFAFRFAKIITPPY